MPTYPVITIKPSYNSIVRGCPGIPETLPRIECELRIRSNNGNPFIIDRIELILKTVETGHLHGVYSHTASLASPSMSLHTPSSAKSSTFPSTSFSPGGNFSLSSPMKHGSISKSGSISGINNNNGKRSNITVSYKKKLRINSDSLPEDKQIIGIDVPVTIGIPDDIKATNYNEKFGDTYTLIEACVYYKLPSNSKRPSTHESSKKEQSNQNTSTNDKLFMIQFETQINIERYDIYPNSKKFPSIKFQDFSSDNRLDINYKLNSTCFGTDDLIKIELDIKPNYQSLATANNINNISSPSSLVFVGQKKKMKIKQITVEVNQVLEQMNSASGLVETKESVLCSTTKTMNELVNSSDMKTRIDLRLLTVNALFKQYENSLFSSEVMFKLPDDDPMATANTLEPGVVISRSKRKAGVEALQYHSSITTRGASFNITHFLVIKFKCGGVLKSFALMQPIIISCWCKPQVKYLENVIKEEKEVAINAKNFYDRFGGIKRVQKREGVLDYPPLPPIILPYDLETMESLGIFHERNDRASMTRVPLIE